jgi:RNA polymerase sigma-70 factor, ECF subfamily
MDSNDLNDGSRMEESSDHESWTHWLRQHGPRLLLLARQWTRSAADAEDVVQDAFVRFWRHQRNLPGSPFALLVTSIRRAAIDLGRRESRRAAREEAAAAGEPADTWFEPEMDGNDERRAALETAIRALPEAQREVIVMKIWNEMTFEEIGRALDCPANTAASRYRYAMTALRRELNAPVR